MTTLKDLCALVAPYAHSTQQSVPRLEIFSLTRPTELTPLVYVPVVCLVLQGRKRTRIGSTNFEYGPGQYIMVAAEVTALGQVYEASEKNPFIAVNLYLDSGIVSSLITEMAELKIRNGVADGFGTGLATDLELDAWQRLADLMNRPEEVPILHPQVERELVFRLLMGVQGKVLREMKSEDSGLARIRNVMSWIRANYTSPLSVDMMAEMAGMSLSVFYRRFKAIAAVSPLQYQKHIRLHEARRRMLTKHESAAAAGFSVGYESAPQFSREYKRLFGNSPARDTDLLRDSLHNNQET